MPNLDQSGAAFGWIRGHAATLPDATNISYLTDPLNAKLAPYTGFSHKIYRCAADKSTVGTPPMPRLRSLAMSQAVGSKNATVEAVDGPWLTGSHGANNNSQGPWRVYGKTSDIIDPAPSQLWVFLDEDEFSINDGGFAVSMTGLDGGRGAKWVDWPGTYHNMAAGFAFADGHSEVHRWLDPRTKVINGQVAQRPVPGSPDTAWICERTSAALTD
jgi:hypothetical protein